ncbi:hypothetical protein ACEPAI_6900 [Sanghuangporus weigelae]
MLGLTLPPFPEDLPTHSLIIVDYGLVKSGDSQVIDKFWKASIELGFWCLKNHGAELEVEGMFDTGEETLALPQEEKMRYLRGDRVFTFGTKQLDSGATNEYGSPDNVEYINVSKEDALAYPEVFHRTYPLTVNARMESTIIPFVQKSVDIIDTVLSVYEMKLGMPAGILLKLHLHMEASGPITKGDVFLGAHTDFGSFSFPHNRLGGLQVFPPGSTEWHYVLPIPGHAISNMVAKVYNFNVHSGADLHGMQILNNLASLLIASINSYQFVLTLLAYPCYRNLLVLQPFATRHSLTHTIMALARSQERNYHRTSEGCPWCT